MQDSSADQQQGDQAASTDMTAETNQDQTTTDTGQSNEQSPVHYPADSQPALEPAQPATVTEDVYSSYQIVKLPSMDLRIEYSMTAGDLLACTLLAFTIIVHLVVFFHRLTFPKGGA